MEEGRVQRIRAFRPADHVALRSICLRTGSSGQDATGRWSSDDLLPDVYLTPYVRFAPDRILVVADEGDAPVGYLLAVPDTAAFIDWWRREVTPSLPFGPVADDPDEQWLRDVGHRPERMPGAALGTDLARFPAHLHIDLLPEAQGRGWGRMLLRTLAERLAAEGVPGIHLAYDHEGNPRAGAFYDRLGFRPADPGRPGLLVIETERLLGT